MSARGALLIVTASLVAVVAALVLVLKSWVDELLEGVTR